MLIEFHMLQHHNTAQQQRRRIRQALARDIRRGAMHGFEDGALIADIARRSETQATDQASAHVGKDIAVEVRHDEDFVAVGRGIGDDFQAGIIQQLGVELDGREIAGDLACRTEEEAVAHLHDRGFVHRAHLSLADVLGVLEGESEDPLRGALGDELDALHDAIDDYVLDTRVFAFGVLADEHRVDVVVWGFEASDGFAGAHVGEQVERAAEGEVEGDVTFTDGCLNTSL